MYWFRAGNRNGYRASLKMGHLKVHKDQLQLNRSRKNLRRDAGHAIADFNMIEDGDLIMVCLSDFFRVA